MPTLVGGKRVSKVSGEDKGRNWKRSVRMVGLGRGFGSGLEGGLGLVLVLLVVEVVLWVVMLVLVKS